MKIISLIPAATEVLYDLGLADNIYGITDECNYPSNVHDKNIVCNIKIDLKNLKNIEIENEILNMVKNGESPYIVDEDKINEINPDFIITQELCNVCAVSKNEIKKIDIKKKIIDYSPKTLHDVPEMIFNVSNILGVKDAGNEIRKNFLDSINLIKEKTSSNFDKPRVFAMEWLDPIYTAGHWVPDMIEVSGGISKLSKSGEKSKKINFSKLIEYAPNYIFVMPCGYNVERTLNEIDTILSNKELNKIPAFKNGQVYIVDADSYFTRPSTRLLEGIKILAKTLQPSIFTYETIPDSVINLHNFIHFESFSG
tara:strand:+ start:1335 stop:2267 length:933 start_codon:yes stop_codon:yes gene_type:complete